MTNAVKHFKFEQRGKRRIHQRPSAAEIDACLPWLHLVATYHPSAALRADDPEPIEAALVEDLRRSWQFARPDQGGADATAAAS